MSPGSSRRLAAHLNLPVGIGDRACFFRPGRRRQDDVGHHRGLCQEDILHDEMLELGDARAGVLEIGVRHRGILPHDIHAPDLTRVRRVDCLDHGESGLLGKRRVPELFVFLADGGVLYVSVVRIEHGYETRVRRALHVVLAAQRVQSRTGPADLPAHQRESDQAACIVGPVYVLRDAHAPEDHRALGAAEGLRDGADCLGVDAADFGDRLRAVACDVFF